jgi:hypothetical protein
MAKKGLLMGGGGAGASRHSDSPVSVEIPGTDTTVADYLITDVEAVLKRQPLHGTLNFPQLRPDLRKEIFRSLVLLSINTIVN